MTCCIIPSWSICNILHKIICLATYCKHFSAAKTQASLLVYTCYLIQYWDVFCMIYVMLWWVTLLACFISWTQHNNITCLSPLSTFLYPSFYHPLSVKVKCKYCWHDGRRCQTSSKPHRPWELAAPGWIELKQIKAKEEQAQVFPFRMTTGSPSLHHHSSEK